MTTFLTLAFLAQVLRISVPYVLAALGGTVSERAGVVNLAIEGILLGAAFATAVGAHHGGAWVGLGAGVAGGAAVAALYGLAVVRFRADQIVAGVALNLLVLGLTRVLLRLVFRSASSSPTVPGFGDGAGTAAFVTIAAVAALGVHLVVSRTVYGLRLRAVGEHPEAAASLGVDPTAVRWRAVLLSGVLAGLGGAWLALDVRGFTDGMSGGRGYIAIAAMILGRWRPIAATAACLLFGLASAVQLNLQTQAGAVARELVQILPYALTIVALAGAIGRARAPAALGRPWER